MGAKRSAEMKLALALCPQCTSPHCNSVFCRFTGLQHDRVAALPGIPYYGPDAFTDPDDLPQAEEEFQGYDFEDEDQRLDDPRHGQAVGLNRDNRGRE